jgi:curved DNA-binding protein CbpA
MSDNDNYYEELGVEPGASRDELREAHRHRVADLEAAREKKGVSESQLQANRDEVARVRAA